MKTEEEKQYYSWDEVQRVSFNPTYNKEINELKIDHAHGGHFMFTKQVEVTKSFTSHSVWDKLDYVEKSNGKKCYPTAEQSCTGIPVYIECWCGYFPAPSWGWGVQRPSVEGRTQCEHSLGEGKCPGTAASGTYVQWESRHSPEVHIRSDNVEAQLRSALTNNEFWHDLGSWCNDIQVAKTNGDPETDGTITFAITSGCVPRQWRPGLLWDRHFNRQELLSNWTTTQSTGAPTEVTAPPATAAPIDSMAICEEFYPNPVDDSEATEAEAEAGEGESTTEVEG